jgi:hypothetical protein
MEARILELEVVELLLVGKEGVKFDEAGAEGGRVIFERLREIDVGLGEDSAFEAGDSFETSGGIGDSTSSNPSVSAKPIPRSRSMPSL